MDQQLLDNSEIPPPQPPKRSYNTFRCWLKHYSRRDIDSFKDEITELYGRFDFMTCQLFWMNEVTRNPEKYY